MRLKNKKTGEIVPASNVSVGIGKDGKWYGSLAELNEEWEDYEEPKEDYIRVIESFIHYVEEADDSFYCDDSVKKFIERLKAWKRLKDARFEFGTIKYNLDEESSSIIAYDGIITIKGMAYEDFIDDLNLLFGGEE